MVTTPTPFRNDALVEALKPSLGKTLKVMYKLIRPTLWLYILIFGATIVEGILSGLTMASLFPVFESLVGSQDNSGGRVLSFVKNLADIFPFSSPLVAAGTLLIVLVFFKCIIMWLVEALSGFAAGMVIHRLRKQLFNRYIRNGFQFFLDHKQGELVYNMCDACLRVSSFFSLLPTAATQLMNIVVIVVLLFSIHVKSTLFIIIGMTIYQTLISIASQKIIFPLGTLKKDMRVAHNVIINEFISGFKQIFVFGVLGQWDQRHNSANIEYGKVHARERRYMGTPKSLLEFIIFSSGALILMWIGLRNPEGYAAEVAAFGVYFVALQRLVPHVSNLARYRMTLSSLLPDAHITYEALFTNPIEREDGHLTSPRLQKDISFKNVNFSYKDRLTLMNDVNFQIQKGKVTALVGKSGSGKSTLLNLILGLFQPTSGEILIDGVNLNDIKLNSWLDQIGIVTQDTFVFNGTIKENITFFRDATDQEVNDAAAMAHAKEFIEEFPEGYETRVGDRGMKLSGGQQQRIALARAILKKPEILILDEATSSLDNLSEKLIQDALNKISKNRTVIIVAHRLSTVVQADQIFVIDNGKIIEKGTHSELIGSKGVYANLYGPNSPIEEKKILDVN